MGSRSIKIYLDLPEIYLDLSEPTNLRRSTIAPEIHTSSETCGDLSRSRYPSVIQTHANLALCACWKSHNSWLTLVWTIRTPKRNSKVHVDTGVGDYVGPGSQNFVSLSLYSMDGTGESPITSSPHSENARQALGVVGEFPLPLMSGLGACSQPADDVRASFFLGDLVRVPQLYCKRLKRPIPPTDWEKDPEYTPQWYLPEAPNGNGMDLEEYNLEIIEKGKTTDFAWLVSGIRDIKVALENEEVRELCHVSWQPCWIPLVFINRDTESAVNVSLAKAKKVFSTMEPKRIKQLSRYIHPKILRFLVTLRESPWEPFYVHKITHFAQIQLDGRPVDIVRAVFCDSYEHCSSMMASRELWKEVNKGRVEAGKKLLKTLGVTAGLTAYIEKAEKHFAELKEPSARDEVRDKMTQQEPEK